MAMDHARVAKDVLTYVGGADNITQQRTARPACVLSSMTWTRSTRRLSTRTPTSKGTFIAGGMFQIIVGPGDVDLVFSEMIRHRRRQGGLQG